MIWAGLQAGARAELFDGVVAAVNGEAVLLSTLRAYMAAYAPSATPSDALQHLIDDRLLAALAHRYGQSLKPAEVAAERARHPAPSGYTGPEWDELVSDHLLATKFMAFRYGDFVPVSRQQEQKYYNQHRASFPQPFNQAEPRIHDLLVPEIRARRERNFLRDLRQRSDVRTDAAMLDAAANAR